MSVRNLFAMTRRVSNLVSQMEGAGMRIEIGDDFARYRALRNADGKRASLYPMFDVTSSYVDATNGFWICGYNQENQVVHTQAARMLELGDTTLKQHLDVHRHKYITPDTTPDPDKTYYTGPQALMKVTGKVCYHGDFWLPSQGLGGLRSQGATGLLSRLLFEMVLHAWSPDYMFALVPKRLAAKGAHLRYGYSHCEPGRWIGPDKQVTEEDHLIWMSRQCMVHHINEQPVAMPVPKPMTSVATTDVKLVSRG
jgi:hypothetical protein